MGGLRYDGLSRFARFCRPAEMATRPSCSPWLCRPVQGLVSPVGVLAATACNHLLAVLAGNYLTDIVPMHIIQIAAAASFILFGSGRSAAMSFRGRPEVQFLPFWTVAIAFFFAEMGDKTQLATVTLAAKFQSVIPSSPARRSRC